MILEIVRFTANLFPARLPEIIYTVLLRPRPLRRLAHKVLLRMLPASVTVDGSTLYLNPTDPVLSSAVAFGIYENYERQVFRQFCREGATVVDVGANIGLYTVIAAARVGKAGKVISIEPHPESFHFLRQTVEANGLSQVRGFNVAAGDSAKTVSLFVTDENKADSRIYDQSAQRPNIPTEMVDLDSLLSANGVDHVDLIKLDIQGAEGLALRGLAKTIARNNNLTLFLEFWPWGLEQTGERAATFLHELLLAGFKLSEIDEGQRRLLDVDNVEHLIASHHNLQYTGADLRRSHTNLICIKGTASSLPADKSPARREMNTNPRLLIFVPTYNEAENVEVLFGQIRALGLNADILFLDDNSPDGTGQIIDRIAAENANVRTIHRTGKLGIGSAHVAGIRWAYEHGYKTLVTMDCDFTHSPDRIADFLAQAEGFDVVVGSRYMQKDSLQTWNLMRKTLTWVGHLLTTTLLRMPYDATGAFRLYRLDRIPAALFDLVESQSYSFFFESLYVLWLNGARVKEIPVELPARMYGHSKMRLKDVVRSTELLVYLFFKTRMNRQSLLCSEPLGAPEDLSAGTVTGKKKAGA